MVVGTEHIDAAIGATRTFVEVVGKISGDVGGFAVALDDYAVAVVAQLARTQPGCAIGLKDVPEFTQSRDGLFDSTRFIQRVLVKVNIEINTKIVQ